MLRYSALAVAITLAMALLRVALTPLWGDRHVLFPFLLGIMLSAWLGGTWPGVVATALSLLTIVAFWLPLTNVGDAVAALLLLAFGIVVSVATGALRGARAHAEETTRELARQVAERTRRDLDARRLAAIVESSDDAIIGKALDGVITSWNAGAERTFGYTAAEAVGQPITMLVPADRVSEEMEILARLRAGQPVERLETLRCRKDGQALHVAITMSPIRDGDGNVVGASSIARDISELKRAEGERADLLERAHAARLMADLANRAKDDFLAVVSHELRTPLQSMLGWVRLLRSGHLDAAVAEKALDTIDRNARAQAQLIEDLLDVSRIIAGKLRLELKPVDLVAIIESAVDTIRASAEAKGIRIELSIDIAARTVAGDAGRLQQVLDNLLSNAMKFTPAGGRIAVGLACVDGRARLHVADTGLGIATDALPHVFERFRQADSSTTRHHGGLGLGLTIVHHLVELHGGTVTAASDGEGRGATFTVELPLVPRVGRTRPHAPRAASVAAPPLHLDGMRVVVVDDDEDTCTLLRTVLERHGAFVATAGAVPDAMAAIERVKPDVVVSDISMPGEDGYALVRRLRELEAQRGWRVSAVALTAHARAEDRHEALQAGFESYAAKPIDPLDFARTIASLGRLGGV